jgi:hypothetical protein
MATIARRSGGYYNRGPMARGQPQQQQQQQRPQQQQQQQRPQQQQRRNRRKRQDWADAWRNGTISIGGPPLKAPDLGPGYFQPQQQVYGGYPAAPSPYGFYNQLYNPAYVQSGYANPNSEYYPGYNGSYVGSHNFNYQNLGVENQPMSDAMWNRSYGAFYNPQLNIVPMVGGGIGSGGVGGQSYYTGSGGFYSGSNTVAAPQSCMAMTGERITIQPLAGAQPGGMHKID